MKGTTKKIIKLFDAGDNFISNVESDEEAGQLLAVRGIDAAKLAEGQALLQTANERVSQSGTAVANQLQATDNFNAAFDASWRETQDLARLLATTLSGQIDKLTLLGLHKRRDETTLESEIAWPRSQSLASFLTWGRNLYQRLTEPELAAAAAALGYDADTIAAQAARLEGVADLDNDQEAAKAVRLQATEDRDKAVDAFKAWYDAQKAIAKVTLRGHTRLLRLLGLD